MNKYPIITAFLFLLSGCATISARVDADLAAFQRDAGKYGSQQDRYCAEVLVKQWEILREFKEDEPAGVVSFAYRAILADRMMLGVEKIIANECGTLAVELAIRVGQRIR